MPPDNETSRERRLAVIVHADVVGSTAMVQRDEGVAHARITDAFARFSALIARYRGTVHEIRGDALVAEFARASDAVTAVLAFQRDNGEYNTDLDDGIVPAVRVGIALGEVVIADATVTGPGVVLAQRVEQLAEAGGICVTGAIQEAAPGRLPFDYADLGAQELKGFSAPVHVRAVTLQDGKTVPAPDELPAPVGTERARFGHGLVGAAAVLVLVATGLAAWLRPWQTPPRPPPPATSIQPAHAGKPSIAVLPFTNMGGEPEQEYFADGMTDDLITDLSRISGLMVIARNSSFVYKGQPVNVQDVGRTLGIRYVLEGSVRRVGARVRINAQLIDTRSGMHVWADRYDRDLKDVLALQDEVTQMIVAALSVRLTPGEQETLRKQPTVNVEAYDLLLKGNEHRNRFSARESALARDFYQQAIALDPGYARAHANLALTYLNDVEFRWTNDTDESINKGLASVEVALGIDDSIPQIHFSRSNLYLLLHRYDDAVAAAQRSVDVDPNFADGYGMLAHCLIFAGEHERALGAMAKAKLLNPHVSYIYLWVEARAFFFLGRYEDALVLSKEALERNPGFESGRLLLAATLAHLGETEEAAWQAEEIAAINPGFSLSVEREQAHYKRLEDLDRYFDGLRKAGLPK